MRSIRFLTSPLRPRREEVELRSKGFLVTMRYNSDRSLLRKGLLAVNSQYVRQPRLQTSQEKLYGRSSQTSGALYTPVPIGHVILSVEEFSFDEMPKSAMYAVASSPFLLIKMLPGLISLWIMFKSCKLFRPRATSLIKPRTLLSAGHNGLPSMYSRSEPPYIGFVTKLRWSGSSIACTRWRTFGQFSRVTSSRIFASWFYSSKSAPYTCFFTFLAAYRT